MTISDHLKIDKQAYYLAKNWYKDGAGDFTLYKGISLGEILEFETMVFFISVLKEVKIFKKIPPKESFFQTEIAPPLSPFIREFKKIFFPLKINFLNFFHHQFLNLKKDKKIYYFDPYTAYSTLPWYLGLKDSIFLGPKSKEYFFNRYREEIRRKVGREIQALTTSVLKNILEGSFINNFILNNIRIWPRLKHIFKEKFLPRLSDLTVEIELTIKFFREYDIKGVILPWDQAGLYKIFALAGRKLNLETFRYQDGVLGEYKYYILPTSKTLLVWGKQGEKYYLSRGIDEERIKIIGYPGIDNLRKWLKEARKDDLKRELNIEENEKLVLFAGTSFEGATSFDEPSFEYLFLKIVCETAKKMPMVKFIVKLHGRPQNTPQARKIISAATAKNILVFDEFNFYKLLAISDILVAPPSTVILEALICKVPPVILEISRQASILNPYRKWPGIFYARSTSDLCRKIEKILKEENIGFKSCQKAKKHIEDYTGIAWNEDERGG